MIGIGVTENVFLEKVSLDDKNTLELTFQETTLSEKRVSSFANIAGDDIVETVTGISMRLWPPNISTKTDITEEKKVALIVNDLNKNKGAMRHLLLAYKTSTELTGLWAESFMGLPIEENTFDRQIQVKSVLEGVHKNMCRIFLSHIKPFLNNRELAFRLLLVRQSKEKHYAAFRAKYIEENPFYESMSIAKEASKLLVAIDPKDPSKGYKPKFTPYEIAEGLDNALPSSRETADKKTGAPGGEGENSVKTTAPAVTAASVFGQ